MDELISNIMVMEKAMFEKLSKIMHSHGLDLFDNDKDASFLKCSHLSLISMIGDKYIKMLKNTFEHPQNEQMNAPIGSPTVVIIKHEDDNSNTFVSAKEEEEENVDRIEDDDDEETESENETSASSDNMNDVEQEESDSDSEIER
eukprot:169017_1